MTIVEKLRTLAKADTTLQSYFGDPDLFRWFDKQLPPGYIKSGSCARVWLVSTVRTYAHETRTARSVSRISQPLVQIDVLDYDPGRARSAVSAIRNWLGEVDFSTDAQFASPSTTPNRHPNFVRDEREGMEYNKLDPPVHVVTIDVRIFNLEE